MPKFSVAHLREQGQDMLLFPLDSAFHQRTDEQQSAVVHQLETRAHSAGLAGGAVVVWEHGGRGYFRGPRQWHTFLRGISLRWVMAQVNREISWT